MKWFSYTHTHTHTHTHNAFSPSFSVGTTGIWSYLKWVLLHGQGRHLVLIHRDTHPEPLHGSWVEFRACLDFFIQAGESAFWHRWFPTAKTFSPAHFYHFFPLNNTFEGLKDFYKIFKCYFLFTVIVQYWLYSLCCIIYPLAHLQFSSVTQSCPTPCDPIDCSVPGLPVHHQLLEFAQTHVHWVSDAIQPSHPLLLSPSVPKDFFKRSFKRICFIEE